MATTFDDEVAAAKTEELTAGAKARIAELGTQKKLETLETPATPAIDQAYIAGVHSICHNTLATCLHGIRLVKFGDVIAPIVNENVPLVAGVVGEQVVAKLGGRYATWVGLGQVAASLLQAIVGKIVEQKLKDRVERAKDVTPAPAQALTLASPAGISMPLVPSKPAGT